MGVFLHHSLKCNILNEVWHKVHYLHVDNYQNLSHLAIFGVFGQTFPEMQSNYRIRRRAISHKKLPWIFYV